MTILAKCPSCKCPSCYTRIELGPKPRQFQRIVCPECEVDLEIIKTNPPLLDWAFDYDENYYDNSDFQYDDLSFERHRS
jgi:hypothetical protein